MNIYVDRFTGRIKTTETEGFDLVVEYQGTISAFKLENFYKYILTEEGYQLSPFIHQSKWKDVEAKVQQEVTIDMLGTMLVNERLKGVE